MAYKITISGSEYPHNETETVTVTAEQLVNAIINEFEYDIIIEDIDGRIDGNCITIDRADADLDDLEASMDDAVFNGLHSLLRDEIEKQN